MTKIKHLWKQIDWGLVQALIVVGTIPAMIIFGSATVLIFDP